MIAKEINNTEKEALDFVKKKLPGLPSLINAKYLNFSNDFSLDPPEHKNQRSPKTFKSNLEHNHGFMRHIFRIPEETDKETTFTMTKIRVPFLENKEFDL